MSKHFRILCFAVLGLFTTASFGQNGNSFQQTNLVSDLPGMASHTDPLLVNAWGISFLPAQPFWIANNGSGTSTTYDGTGTTQLQPVTVPGAAGSSGPAPVTGEVANTTPDFAIAGVPSLFLFVTEDGTVSGWGGAGTATIAKDNSSSGAVYKGLAIGSNSRGNFLYAANFHSGHVDVFDRNFNEATLAGSFTDPNLPAGYAPFGIQNIGNNQIVVTYALQDSAKHDDVAGPGNGYVNLFDTDGNFKRRIASQQTLNSPWGIAMAPASFGDFGGALLIGNFGDGRIMAFDLATGNPLGELNNTSGLPLTIDGLWGMTFGGGGQAGDANSLYFTAGLNGETHGLFGKLDPATSGSTADFTIAAGQPSITVARGSSKSVQINVGATGGFSGTVSFSCTGPAQVSCTFSPATVPAGNATSTMMTVSVGSGYVAGMQTPIFTGFAGEALIAGAIMLWGLYLLLRFRRPRLVSVGAFTTALLGCLLLFQTACGYKNPTGTTGGPQTLTITGTSGAVSHSTTMSLTVQ